MFKFAAFLTLISLSHGAYATSELLPESIFSVVSGVENGLGNLNGTAILLTNHYVITNYHVVENVTVKQPATLFYPLQLSKMMSNESMVKEYCSPEIDYCIMKLNSEISGDPIKISQKEVGFDDDLKLIGNKNGSELRMEEGKMYPVHYANMFLHCIPETNGDSGGAILNQDNELVAINTGNLKIGGGCNGGKYIGTAIPIKTILEHLSKFRPNIYRQLNILN